MINFKKILLACSMILSCQAMDGGDTPYNKTYATYSALPNCDEKESDIFLGMSDLSQKESLKKVIGFESALSRGLNSDQHAAFAGPLGQTSDDATSKLQKLLAVGQAGADYSQFTPGGGLDLSNFQLDESSSQLTISGTHLIKQQETIN